MDRLRELWKRDQLGVLGVASVIVAFLTWAFPVRGMLNYGLLQTRVLPDYIQSFGYFENIVIWELQFFWFTSERQEVVVAFLALAFVLLLLRRR